jgi:hypothetical protein
MSFLISLALPLLLCLVITGITSFIWRDDLARPVIFAMTGFLATFGLHRVIQAGTKFLGLFRSGGYFLEARNPPDILQLAKENMNTETLVQCALLLILGLPLLHLLRTAMVKAYL